MDSGTLALVIGIVWAVGWVFVTLIALSSGGDVLEITALSFLWPLAFATILIFGAVLVSAFVVLALPVAIIVRLPKWRKKVSNANSLKQAMEVMECKFCGDSYTRENPVVEMTDPCQENVDDKTAKVRICWECLNKRLTTSGGEKI